MAASPAHVGTLLAQTLHPGSQAAGAAGLRALEVQGSGLVASLVSLVSDAQAVPPEVRLAAALYLKNIIVRLWGDDSEGVLSQKERAAVRGALVGLMVAASSAPAVQRTLGEAIVAVASLDFPELWPEAAAALVSHISASDLAGSVAALRTLHRVAKPYREALRSDELYTEINALMAAAGGPLVELLVSLTAAVRPGAAADERLVRMLLYSDRLVRSLCAQDLPAAFEDRLSDLIGALSAQLSLALGGGASLLARKASAAASDALAMLVDRYDEDVEDMLPAVVDAAASLLFAIDADDADADRAACSGLHLLAALARHPKHVLLPSLQARLVAEVVLPQMRLRPGDLVMAAGDAEEALEWVRREVEPLGAQSRRAAAVSLARALVDREALVSGDSADGHVRPVFAALQAAVSERMALPPDAWRERDAAVALYAAVGEDAAIDAFFGAHVLCDIRHDAHPALRAGALRFAGASSARLGAASLRGALGAISSSALLSARTQSARRPAMWLATEALAAYAADRLLVALASRPDALGDAVAASGALLGPVSETLRVMAAGEDASEFVAGLVHRCCAVVALAAARDAVVAPLAPGSDPHVHPAAARFAETLLPTTDALAAVLASVTRTPAAFAPAFGSAVCEAAALLASVPSDRVQLAILGAVEPPLFAVLLSDVPSCAFDAAAASAAQIVAAAIVSRTHTGLALSHRVLPVLVAHPHVWASAASVDVGVPSLVRLLAACVHAAAQPRHSPSVPHAADVPNMTLSDAAIAQVLAVFQRLVATRTHDVAAIALAASVFSALRPRRLQPFMPAVLVAVLRKLQAGAARKPRLAHAILALLGSIVISGVADALSAEHGHSMLKLLATTPVPHAAVALLPAALGTIQPGLAAMVLTSLAPHVAKIRDAHDRRLAAAALVLLATRCPSESLGSDAASVTTVFSAVAESARAVAAYDHASASFVSARLSYSNGPLLESLAAATLGPSAASVSESARASSSASGMLRSASFPQPCDEDLRAMPAPHILLRVGLAALDPAVSSRLLGMLPPAVVEALRVATF